MDCPAAPPYAGLSSLEQAHLFLYFDHRWALATALHLCQVNKHTLPSHLGVCLPGLLLGSAN